jgi:Fe-S cluster assembly protein SufD
MLDAQSHFEQIRDTLPGDGPARAARLAAAEAVGLPTRRVESWHYTDLARLLKSGEATSVHTVDFSSAKALETHFEDGVLLNPPQAEGLTLAPFVGSLEAPEAPSPDTVMATYNQALAQNGLVAQVSGTLVQPLVLRTSGAEPVHLAHKITLAAGAKAVLVDDHMATGYTNVVLDITLGEGAELTLLRSQQAGHQVGLSRVTLAEGARYKSVALVSGGTLARQEAHVTLQAASAHAELHSAVLGHGLSKAATHADFTYVIEHQAADTSSHTSACNVLDGDARGVFQGKIIVRPDAQRVDARMQTRAMMLSQGAEMDAKPELEIYADDVVCAHGSAIGELDRDALFFLRSRGLEEATARHLLVAAFLQQVISHIDDEALSEIIGALVEVKINALLSPLGEGANS